MLTAGGLTVRADAGTPADGQAVDIVTTRLLEWSGDLPVDSQLETGDGEVRLDASQAGARPLLAHFGVAERS